MKFNDLQEIGYYLSDNSNEAKSYNTVGDLVNELTEISNTVYEVCDDYRDIASEVNLSLLSTNISDAKYDDYEENIDYIIEAAENLLEALK